MGSFIIVKEFSSTALENHSSFLNVIPALKAREQWAGFWTCCAAAAFRCWCRSGRGTAGFVKVKSSVFLLFLLCLYFPIPSVPYTVTVQLNTTLFMPWPPPSMFRFPILQVSGNRMNEWILPPSFSFESLQTSHPAWREIPGKSLGVISHQEEHTHAIPVLLHGRKELLVCQPGDLFGRWIWSSKGSCSLRGVTKPCWFAPLWAQEFQIS